MHIDNNDPLNKAWLDFQQLVDGIEAMDMAPRSLDSLMEPQWSVCQFLADGSYEYVRRFVVADEAKKAFYHYCTSVGARLGITQRVIITDGGDCIAAEWKYGAGLTAPPIGHE